MVNVVKSLKTRNKYRCVTITLTPELESIYLDVEGNVVFHELYLEEVNAQVSVSEVPLVVKSARSLAKDMVIEIFNGENCNAEAWIKQFIQECTRVGISEEKYTETLRIFLEKSALDWFSIFSKSNPLSSNWELWNNSFLDTFAVQSWSDIAYAINFKYMSGSLLEFALKKRRLILETDEKMTLTSQMNLLVTSLPKVIQNKIERKSLMTMEDLMGKLKQMKNFTDKEEKKSSNKPCNFCEAQGFANRWHDESVCRLKKTKLNSTKNGKIRVVNNTEAQEVIVKEEESKN